MQCIRFQKYDDSLIKNYSKEVQDLLCMMLQKKKEERINIEEILKKEFIYVKNIFLSNKMHCFV